MMAGHERDFDIGQNVFRQFIEGVLIRLGNDLDIMGRDRDDAGVFVELHPEGSSCGVFNHHAFGSDRDMEFVEASFQPTPGLDNGSSSNHLGSTTRVTTDSAPSSAVLM